MKLYTLSVAGGTFDRFHKGHKTFLECALRFSQKLILGITSETYLQQHKLESGVESFDKRKKAVEAFFVTQNATNRVTIIPIDTPFIPQEFSDYPFEAIIVSEETKKGADLINEERKRQHKAPLAVVKADSVFGDDGKLLSSTRIRNGEVDRNGKSTIKKQWLDAQLYLPEELRRTLQTPFGELVLGDKFNPNDFKHQRVITVGDIVSESFFQSDTLPDIAVVDLHVERKQKYSQLSQHTLPPGVEVIAATNPAGTLTPSTFRAVMNACSAQKRAVIHVDGEEDLVVLPLVLRAPLDWIVLYGQPHEGVVKIMITEDVKAKTYDLVSKFSLKKGL